ncbi:MAG: hypothetical protein ACYTG3_13155 [Planctomycetota bacterium]|jgi:hypothetical protein
MISISYPNGWISPRRVVRRRGGIGDEVTDDVQLLCDAGPYELDLLVRVHPARGEFDLLGQVTLGGSIYRPVADLELTLVAGADELDAARTRTDDFGEFDLMSGDAGLAYGLRVGAGAEALCVLVWDGNPGS